jgi:hypothetical protein
MLSGVLLVLVAFAIHRAIFVPPPGSWGTAGGIMFALAAGGFVLVGFGLGQWGRAIAARLRSSGHD